MRAEAGGKVLFEESYTCMPADGYAEKLGAVELKIPNTDELTVTLSAHNSHEQYENTINYLVF